MRIAIITLGCDKNTVDSEYMAGLLEEKGHEVISPDSFEEDFDALVINTCGFIDAAREESVNTIIDWEREKIRRRNENRGAFRLFVVGCLSERYAADLRKSFPEIDGWAGVGKWFRIVSLIENDSRDKKPKMYVSLPSREPSMRLRKSLPRKSLEDLPYSFLKIADGCSHRCRFCAIPLIKGKYASVPRKILLQEARNLIDRGTREINIVAQDINHYGRDIYKRYRLADLVEELANLPGKFRIRLLYFYPEPMPDKLISLMRDHPGICPYIDIPLQHLSPSVLKKMGRPFDTSKVLEMLDRWREEIPDLAIRTAFIVGFPGETDSDFDFLLDEVKEFRFDRMGAFLYSPEEQTPAEKDKPAVPAKIAQKRLDRLMEVQEQISLELNTKKIGREFETLFDQEIPEQEMLIGRTAHDAPEVDGVVVVPSHSDYQAGDFGRVRITRADSYDLFGEIEEEGGKTG